MANSDVGLTSEEQELVASAPDWRIWLGLGITAVWVLGQLYYVIDVVRWGRFIHGGPATMGGFLEGAFAPLAFLWLVIGYFLQQKELANSTRAIRMQHVEMRRTTVQAARQAEAISASEQHARRDTFLRLIEVVNDQLAGILGMIFMSSQSTAGEGNFTPEEINQMWGALGTGDRMIFARQLIAINFQNDPVYAWGVFWATPVRTRHSKNFIETFERLMAEANASDVDGLLPTAVLGSSHGRVYQAMIQHRDEPPAGAEPLQS